MHPLQIAKVFWGDRHPMGFPQEPNLAKTFNPAGAAELTIVSFALIGSAMLSSQAHPLDQQHVMIQAAAGFVHTVVATATATLGTWKACERFNDLGVSPEAKAIINSAIAIAGVLGLFCEAASSDNFWIRAAAVAVPSFAALKFGASYLRLGDYDENHNNRIR